MILFSISFVFLSRIIFFNIYFFVFLSRVIFYNTYFLSRMIRGLGTEIVVQIAAGDRHSLALTKGGQLFIWGDNSFGQLGIGKGNGNKANTPQVI